VNGVYCNRCGHLNPLDASFCSSCGARLDLSASDQTVTIAEEDTALVEDMAATVAAPGPVLVVERGHRAGATYLFDGDVVRIGRHPDSDIFLDDVTVSRRHVEVTRDGDQWVLTDAGSLNGTYVNRERVERGVLRSGDHLQVGKFRLVFLDRPEEG
jgi:pSer/pThr/pTyr-binding forkhead associated (FHA) protein